VLNQGSRFIVRVPLGSAHLDPQRIHTRSELIPAMPAGEAFVHEAHRWLPILKQDPDQNIEQRVWTKTGLVSPGSAAVNSADYQSQGQRTRIVWADDNADMREYVSRLLGERFEVEAVADGQAALEAVRSGPPDLVLADVMMPRLDGFGLLQALRADPQLREIPIILLSARAGEEARIEGMEAGADDYLIKPFSTRELLARVEAHVRMTRIRREAEAALQENAQRLRLAQRAGRVGIFEWQIPQNRVIWSAELERLYGLAEGSFEGTFDAWSRRVVAEDAERVAQGVDTCLRERCTDYTYDFRIILPDGAQRWLAGQAQFSFDDQGRPLRMIGVNVDIDEHKQTEELLREADRRKDEFLATLAHELRNPLAPLRNGLEVMKLAGDNSEPVAQARVMMERQLEQMVRLIDDLLDISRISRGRIELRRERVELGRVVHNTVETTRPLIEQSGHKFTIDIPADPIWLDADVTRLGQVFSNLLNNAAKFTGCGGHVQLTVACRDDKAVVTVGDNGIGIPADMLFRVFDLFTQVDRSLEKASGGLGIGLSLVKSLVELHGGSIEASSEGYGRGSEFVVHLPLAQSAGSAQPENMDTRCAGDGSGHRILVVDDNCDAADSLAMILQIRGNDTRTAYDGLAALDVAAAFRPDVVLLDIGMPKLNGYDTARRLRTQPWGRNITLIALTGWGQDEDRQQSQAAGFNFHLVKPIEPAALEKLLAELHEAKMI
jgi:PAS domain S-box-containing protein